MPSDRELEAAAEWFAGMRQGDAARLPNTPNVTDVDLAYAESVLSRAATARPDFSQHDSRAENFDITDWEAVRRSALEVLTGHPGLQGWEPDVLARAIAKPFERPGNSEPSPSESKPGSSAESQ